MYIQKAHLAQVALVFTFQTGRPCNYIRKRHNRADESTA